MQFIRDLSVRAKLFGGFGAVLGLTAVLGVVLILQIGSVHSGGLISVTTRCRASSRSRRSVTTRLISGARSYATYWRQTRS